MNDFERLRATFKGLAFKQLGYAPLLDDEVDAGLLAVLREMRLPSIEWTPAGAAAIEHDRDVGLPVTAQAASAYVAMLDCLIAQAEASESKAAE